MGTWGYTVYKNKYLLYLIVIAYWTVNLPSLWLGPIDLHIPQIPNSTHLRQSYMVGIPQSHILVLVQRSFLKIVQFSAGKKNTKKHTFKTTGVFVGDNFHKRPPGNESISHQKSLLKMMFLFPQVGYVCSLEGKSKRSETCPIQN